MRIRNLINLDRIGIYLSVLCAIHCALTPLLILVLPVLAVMDITHPWFHWVMAAFVVPIGILAFVGGYLRHHNHWVLSLGIPGLLVVGIFPIYLHELLEKSYEPVVMIAGSALLVAAHYINRKCFHCDEVHRH